MNSKGFFDLAKQFIPVPLLPHIVLLGFIIFIFFKNINNTNSINKLIPFSNPAYILLSISLILIYIILFIHTLLLNNKNEKLIQLVKEAESLKEQLVYKEEESSSLESLNKELNNEIIKRKELQSILQESAKERNAFILSQVRASSSKNSELCINIITKAFDVITEYENTIIKKTEINILSDELKESNMRLEKTKLEIENGQIKDDNIEK